MVHQIIKYICALSVCLIVSISADHASAQNRKCEKEIHQIKNFELSSTPIPMTEAPFFNMKGEPVSLQDYKGKVVLLNHWAIWCAPCLREMPSIMRLSKSVDPEKIVIMPLSMDRGKASKVHRFVMKKEWSETAFFHDPKMSVAKESGIQTIPATQIIDKTGAEVGRLVGTYEWDAPEVVDLLNCLAK